MVYMDISYMGIIYRTVRNILRRLIKQYIELICAKGIGPLCLHYVHHPLITHGSVIEQMRPDSVYQFVRCYKCQSISVLW